MVDEAEKGYLYENVVWVGFKGEGNLFVRLEKEIDH